MTSEESLVTEVPSSLKQLARIVVRGFYTIEDSLIIDMLVRNPCIKEDDICELLKFDRKMLRARITALRNDKFIQVRLRMETGSDGKAQKVNYYFINYKTFVNVVKYKLHLMSKRMDTEERDATSRASYKCNSCSKTFTDLEADQLFDPESNDFRCTYCRDLVTEDESALPKTNSRLLMAKFNEQLEPLYNLLQEVEGIKLAPEILEPEPVDINTIRGLNTKKSNNLRGSNDQWSGEATRSSGFAVEDTRIDVTIGDDVQDDGANKKKERPIWMMESTITTSDAVQNDRTSTQDSTLDEAAANANGTNSKQSEDIMSVLLAHEKKGGINEAAVKTVLDQDSSDSSDMENNGDMQPVAWGDVEEMDSEDDDDVPFVKVNGKSVPITDVLLNPGLAEAMTAEEKLEYSRAYQEYCDDE